MHTTKQIPSIVFKAVKDENDLIWSKLKQRKQEKDFVKIDHLKKKAKCFVHHG